MVQPSSDDNLKLNRRIFLQFTAATSAVSAGLAALALKTDALAQQATSAGSVRGDDNFADRYPYINP